MIIANELWHSIVSSDVFKCYLMSKFTINWNVLVVSEYREREKRGEKLNTTRGRVGVPKSPWPEFWPKPP